ncbi:CopG family transcriptional regulator [Agrobacterium tumefaciens]|uniref:CopG family transcriptional regulator n=1 Tax=Agrobacterium tumefaciens TaxID=358 RepID=A0A0D0KUI5_AGRTU|nr:CopG family transcriptional regulator [Agrobacterium tumefaciens]
MEDQRNLSNPITMRLPKDVLAEIEEIAAACDRTRSWVFVRALKSYLATEGRDILTLAQARQQVDRGEAVDLDDLIDEVDHIVKGAAA